MLLLSRQERDGVAPSGGKSALRISASPDISAAVPQVAKRRCSLEFEEPNRAKVATSFLTEEVLQLRNRNRKGASSPMLASMPKDLVSAYDRMRTRRFACLILKGVKTTAAAQVAEAEAMESLAILAKERGFAAVTTATGGALWRRRSCVEHMLRRRSIAKAVAVAEAESEAAPETTAMSTAGVNKCLPQALVAPPETCLIVASKTPAGYVRTRIRKRASLTGRESLESSEDTDVPEDCLNSSVSPTRLGGAVVAAETRQRLRRRATQLLRRKAPKRQRKSE